MELSLMELIQIKISLQERADILRERDKNGTYGKEELSRIGKLYWKVDEEFRKKRLED